MADLVITQTSCNNITITNPNLSDRDYNIYVMNEGVLDDYLVGENVKASSDVSWTIDTDGVYVVEDVDASKNTVIMIDCAARSCMKSYLDSLIQCNTETNCDCDDCEQKEYYNFNTFITLYNVYLMLTSQYVYFGNPLTTIDAAKLLELNKISDILLRMNDYCNTCDEPCNNC